MSHIGNDMPFPRWFLLCRFLTVLSTRILVNELIPRWVDRMHGLRSEARRRPRGEVRAPILDSPPMGKGHEPPRVGRGWEPGSVDRMAASPLGYQLSSSLAIFARGNLWSRPSSSSA